LAEEVEIINIACLSEACGEGYHRGTNVEKRRAPASKSHHLKRNNRFTQENRRIRDFVRKHGGRGIDVVRFEWKRYKRILQTKWASRWTPALMKPEAVFDRIYHDDAKSQEDWGMVVTPEVPQRPVQTENNEGRAGCETEYLHSVFERHGIFGIPQRQEFIGEDGRQHVEQDMQIVQVLHTRGGHSRPHVMPTFENADMPYLTASLSLELQPMLRLPEADDVEDRPPQLDRCRLAFGMDSYWVSARELAPFDVLGHKMITWAKREPSETDEGVLVVSEKKRAKPSVYILHETCPTLCVVYALGQAGWSGEPRTLVVDNTNVGE